MTRAEQETVIRWDREEQVVNIWSADPTVWRKLARLGMVVQEETHAQRTGEITGRFYVPIPVARFRWGTKREITRERTAAQVAAGLKLGARAAAARQNNVSGGTNR